MNYRITKPNPAAVVVSIACLAFLVATAFGKAGAIVATAVEIVRTCWEYSPVYAIACLLVIVAGSVVAYLARCVEIREAEIRELREIRSRVEADRVPLR